MSGCHSDSCQEASVSFGYCGPRECFNLHHGLLEIAEAGFRLRVPASVDDNREITGQKTLEPSNAEMLDWSGCIARCITLQPDYSSFSVGMLDDRYGVSVERTSPYQGVLTISEGDEILHRESVVMIYDAQFGPDLDDVRSWKKTAVQFIDSRKQQLAITVQVRQVNLTGSL